MQEIKITETESESTEEKTDVTTEGKKVEENTETTPNANTAETTEKSAEENETADAMTSEENSAEDEASSNETRKELQIPEFLTNKGKGSEKRTRKNVSAQTPPNVKNVRKVAKQAKTEDAKTLEKQEAEENVNTESVKEDTKKEKDTVHYTSNNIDEEAKKRKRKKKLKKILKTASILCMLAIISLIIIQGYRLYKSRLQTDENGNLYRNLDYKFSELTEEPTNRTAAWDNELKGFVENDMAKAKKKKVSLIYEYGSQKLFFEYDDDKMWLYNMGYVGPITNCSIYKNSSNEIIVYGTNSDREFIRAGFSKLQGGYNILGNYNVPLNTETTEVAELIDGYYLCVNENKVFMCKDKQIVTTEYDIKSKVSKIIIADLNGLYSSYYPLVYTEDKSLYIPIVVEDDNKDVKVVLKLLGNDINIPDDVSLLTCVSIDDYNLGIPMLENNSESILFIPNNIEVYSEYFYNKKPLTSTQEKEADWNAVPLKQQVIKATISYTIDSEYTYKKWCVKLYLNIADKIATYEYTLDGIDTSVEVPDSEKESYNCYSEDEYWNAVEEIRNLYAKYYSQRP